MWIIRYKNLIKTVHWATDSTFELFSVNWISCTHQNSFDLDSFCLFVFFLYPVKFLMNENSKMNKKNEWLIFSPFVIKWFNCKQTFGDTITCTLQQTDYNRWISETVACDFFFFFSCCFVFSFSTHWVWSSINSSFYTWSESYQMNFIIKLIKTKKMLVYICICVWFSLSLIRCLYGECCVWLDCWAIDHRYCNCDSIG